MSTVITPPPMGWAPTPEAIYRLSVAQYEAMVSSGVLTKRDRLHLIDGILVTKMTKKPPHVVACEKARDGLLTIFRAGWRVMVEAPVRISDYSEPEPDVALARGGVIDYRDRHPGPADVPLLVEVSDTSLQQDRDLVPVYGRAADGYASCQVFEPGQEVPVVIDGVEYGRIAVDDWLP